MPDTNRRSTNRSTSPARCLAVMGLLIGLCAACAPAEPPVATAPAPRPTESVLKRIPADAIGYAVVPSYDQTMRAADRMVTAMGPIALAARAMMPDGLGTFVRTQLQLGDGFGKDGGMAVVLLSPESIGADPVTLARRLWASQNIPAREVLLVFLLPGRSVPDVLAAYRPRKEGQLWQMNVSSRRLVAGQVGDYIVLGFHRLAVEAVRNAKANALSTLTPADVQRIESAHLAVRVDMAAAGKILDRIGRKAEKDIHDKLTGDEFVFFAPVLMMMRRTSQAARAAMGEMTEVLATMYFLNDGIAMRERLTWKDGGTMARRIATQDRNAGSPRLIALGSEPTLLAFAYRGDAVLNALAEGKARWMVEMIDGMSAVANNTYPKGLPAATRTALRTAGARLAGQIRGVRAVYGQPQAGLMSVGMIFDVADEAAFRKDLATATAAMGKALAACTATAPKPMERTSLAYVRDAEQDGGRSMDAIVLQHDGKTATSAEQAKAMMTLLGQKDARLLISAVGKKEVLLTLGGGKAFHAAAAKSVSSPAVLLSDADRRLVRAHLPADPTFVMAMYPARLAKLVKALHQRIAPGEKLPLQVSCKQPVLLAGVNVPANSTQPATSEYAAHLPSALLRDAVFTWLAMQTQPADNANVPLGP